MRELKPSLVRRRDEEESIMNDHPFFLRTLATILCRTFFRKITFSGSPYLGPSAIWAGNHTSAIVDPAVVLGMAPVFLRPLAKHTLWGHPAMNPLLRWSRAIPVMRVQDMSRDVKAGLNQQRNSGAFAAVSEALHGGSKILIFPEGVSHDEPHIHRLKTGIARMAVQAVESHLESDFSVVIQPFTIDYFEKDEFRSDVALHFCEPLIVKKNEADVHKIMEAVSGSLNQGYASFFTWDEKRNWLFIYEMTYGHKPVSARDFCYFVEKFRAAFDVESAVSGRLQLMRRMLSVMNLSPAHLHWGELHQRKWSFCKLFLRHAWFHLLFAWPLSVLESVLWYVPYQVTRLLAWASTSERDLLATMKIAHGAWVFPLWNVSVSFGACWFLTTFLFTNIAFWPAFFVCLFLTPGVLVLSTWANERTDFLPGYWRLVTLRFLRPRIWKEILQEWQDLVHDVARLQDRVPAPEQETVSQLPRDVWTQEGIKKIS